VSSSDGVDDIKRLQPTHQSFVTEVSPGLR